MPPQPDRSDDPLAQRPKDQDRDDAPDEGGADGGDDDQPQRANDEDDPQELRERVRKQRAENLRLNRRLKELESRTQNQATVEERTGRIEQERDRYRTELMEERATRSIMAAASRAGAVDPEDVADLMLRRNMVNFDSEGRPEDVRVAVEELRMSKPHLFTTKRVPDADAGRGNGRAGDGEQKHDWNSAFRRAATGPPERR